jgi:hypothetical protein
MTVEKRQGRLAMSCTDERPLPDRVPVLRPDQICAGYVGPDGGPQTCLLGWCERVFGPTAYVDGAQVVFSSRALGAIRYEIRLAGGAGDVGAWSDAHGPREAADLWNRAMERQLGYAREGDAFVRPAA